MLPTSFERESLIGWDLANWAKMVGPKPQGSSIGGTACTVRPAMFHSFWGLNSGLWSSLPRAKRECDNRDHTGHLSIIAQFSGMW